MADNGGGGGGGRTPTSSTYNANVGNLTPTATPASGGGLSQQRFSKIAGVSTTGRKFAGTPLALYSSNTWVVDNGQPAQSAALPRKQNWDAYTTGRNSPASSNLGAPAAQSYSASPLRSEFFVNSPIGLGVTSNNSSYGPVSENRKSGVKTDPSLPKIHYTQTAQYHSNSAMPSPLSQEFTNELRHTDPLPQNPFAWQSHSGENSSNGSVSSHFQTVPDTPSSTALTFATQPPAEYGMAEQPMSPSSSSVAISTISDHYTKTNPEKAGHKGEVWSERFHPRGLRRALKDDIEWIEAYPGAMHTLSAINPEQYQMPYGTRVVNVKTDFPNNIIKAIRTGKLSQMRKVSLRTMDVWNARQDPKEKVLFIFSVNGSGRFCGLAEMSGPWNPDDSIAGWESRPDSEPPLGTFPLTWLYIKDVAYHQFKHARQPNGHPVGNMWNGMHFHGDTGRRVVELYVKCPATSSIIGHPKNQNEGDALIPYIPFKDYDYSEHPVPQSNSHRGGYNMRGTRGGRGGNFRGSAAFNSRHWRAPSNPYSNASESEPKSPVAEEPKMFKLQAGQTIPAGSVFGVKMNKHGQLVLCPGDSASQDAAPVSAPFATNAQLPANNGPHHAQGSFNNNSLPGARSLSSLRSNSTISIQTRNENPSSATSQYFTMAGAQNTDGHYAVQSSQAPAMQYSGEQTPTHRPVPRGNHEIDTKILLLQGGPVADLGNMMLKAKFHGILAEFFMIKDALENPNLDMSDSSMLRNKLNNILAEKQEVETQLFAKGIVPKEIMLSARHDSFSSTDGANTSSTGNYNISPVRAEDGRVLKSASKYGSPPRQYGSFDRAPGGSARQNKGHAYKESYDDHMKKSINDLLASPESTPVPMRSANQVSGFYQPSMGNAVDPFNASASAEQRAFRPTFGGQQSQSFNEALGQPNNGNPPANFTGQQFYNNSAPNSVNSPATITSGSAPPGST